jgi:hypothetical protein
MKPAQITAAWASPIALTTIHAAAVTPAMTSVPRPFFQLSGGRISRGLAAGAQMNSTFSIE